jgi:hypothetical protein
MRTDITALLLERLDFDQFAPLIIEALQKIWDLLELEASSRDEKIAKFNVILELFTDTLKEIADEMKQDIIPYTLQ